MLTQKILKDSLDYNKETGVFVWRIRVGVRVNVGDVAGCADVRYIKIGLEGKTHFAHRLAWLYVHGELPKNQIDHINHVCTDNRIVNLREVTHLENGKNQSLHSRNKSGVLGINRKESSNKWQAYIGANRKNIFLGYFTDKFDAICARKSAENKFNFHKNHGNNLQVLE